MMGQFGSLHARPGHRTGKRKSNPNILLDPSSSPISDVDSPSTVANTLRNASQISRRSTTSLTLLFKRRRWRKRRGSLSASFNLNENDIKVELINVNLATEEELMTLPGINRTLARNVVNHRQLIEGFRKIEDLALVSGMGAMKLDMIRPEICIMKRKNLSRNSSKTNSLESLPSAVESLRLSRGVKLVNINSATVFDLMGVNGINQALAARIITFRERKGPFKTVDELKNVGMSYRRLRAIRGYLIADSTDISEKGSLCSNNNSPGPNKNDRQNGYITKGHSRGSSVPLEQRIQEENFERSSLRSRNSENPVIEPKDDMKDIFELMSTRSSRPSKLSSFNFTENGLPAYRIATWNLEQLTSEKIENPGVLEVFTRTIVENGFSVVAVQEIYDVNSLDKICSELNSPRHGAGVDCIGKWRSLLHKEPIHFTKGASHLGLLFNEELVEAASILESDDFSSFKNGSLWQFGIFKIKIKSGSLAIVNVCANPLTKPHSGNGHANSERPDVNAALEKIIKDEELLGGIIIGHFTFNSAEHGLGSLKDNKRVCPDGLEDKNIPSTLCTTSGLKEHLTGTCGFVEEGLTHLAIPNGWSWGGKATSHGPLWATFYNIPHITAITMSDDEDEVDVGQIPLPNISALANIEEKLPASILKFLPGYNIDFISQKDS